MIAQTCAGEIFFVQCQYQKITGAFYSRIKVSALEHDGRLLDIEDVRWPQRHCDLPKAARSHRCRQPMQLSHGSTNPCTAAGGLDPGDSEQMMKR